MPDAQYSAKQDEDDDGGGCCGCVLMIAVILLCLIALKLLWSWFIAIWNLIPV